MNENIELPEEQEHADRQGYEWENCDPKRKTENHCSCLGNKTFKEDSFLHN